MTLVVLFLGLQWALLQSLAWTGMILSYSRNTSLTEAVSRTFDGHHPCPLCKAIQQARAEEKQEGPKQVKPESKLDWALVWQTPVFHFACDPLPASPHNAFVPSRSDEPPKPRPRSHSANLSVVA